jgi:Tol biopolymer transport system component
MNVRARLASTLVVVVSAAPVSVAQSVVRLSVRSDGTERNGSSYAPRASADGRFVVFEYDASNLRDGDGVSGRHVFLADRETGETSPIAVVAAGAIPDAETVEPSISGDGRFVAFTTTAWDGACRCPIWSALARQQVAVLDRAVGTTVPVSVTVYGTLASSDSHHAAISADGRFVAFDSLASNLAPGTSYFVRDIYLRDLQAGTTVRVSSTPDGSAGANAETTKPVISPDGRYVAFASPANNIVSDDHNLLNDVFVWDRISGRAERVSVSSSGAESNGACVAPSISADGRFVAFTSAATTLAPVGTTSRTRLFVRDRVAGTTTWESFEPTQPIRVSVEPAMSSDGRLVAYFAILEADPPDLWSLVVRDRRSGSLTQALVDSNGIPRRSRNSVSEPPVWTADSRTLLFATQTPLVPDDRNANVDVYARDWSTISVASVEPGDGSEAGDDLVTLRGAGFQYADALSVRFGDATANLVEVSPTGLRVRTPAGTGTVDVTVESIDGFARLDAAYAYVAPELATRYGNVNVGDGPRDDVLLVNATVGDPLTRTASLRVGEPVEIAVAAPRTLPTARFAMYGWVAAPTSASMTVVPLGIGRIALPIPATGGTPQPAVIFDNAGHRRSLGAPTLPSRPAPTVLLRRPAGAARPGTLTLQGLIEDDGAANPFGWSVTNAIVIVVAP